MCLHLNGFLLCTVESIFSLDLSELGWGKELRIPDCLLLRSRVPVNGKGMFWITGGFKSPPATSEWQREQKKQRVLSFTEAETTTDNLGTCPTAQCWIVGEICCCKTQKNQLADCAVCKDKPSHHGVSIINFPFLTDFNICKSIGSWMEIGAKTHTKGLNCLCEMPPLISPEHLLSQLSKWT